MKILTLTPTLTHNRVLITRASSDETWNASISGEDYDDEFDDEKTSWQEIPINYKNFKISFNQVDHKLEHGYRQEVKAIKRRILEEYDSLCTTKMML